MTIQLCHSVMNGSGTPRDRSFSLVPVPSKKPIVEGEVTTVDIQRGCYDLGISVVGGLDTPLVGHPLLLLSR